MTATSEKIPGALGEDVSGSILTDLEPLMETEQRRQISELFEDPMELAHEQLATAPAAH